jgi:hypothetical protein
MKYVFQKSITKLIKYDKIKLVIRNQKFRPLCIKRVLITAFIMAAWFSCQGQQHLEMYGSASAGWHINYQTPGVSAEIDFSAFGFHIKPSVMVTWGLADPAYFTTKFSYETNLFPINQNADFLTAEAGAGISYELWSTDRDAENLDGHKNGVVYIPFISLHYKRFFLQYDYVRGSMVSVGMRVHL